MVRKKCKGPINNFKIVSEFSRILRNHLGFIWQKKIVKNLLGHVCQTCSKDKQKYLFFPL